MSAAYLGLASGVIIVISGSLWFRSIQRVEIPRNRGAFVAAWVAAAALGLAALTAGPGWLGGIPASLGLFTSAFFLLTVAIGGQKVGDSAIQVGATIPAFTSIDEAGRAFDSQSLAGHPVLIKFFRGHW